MGGEQVQICWDFWKIPYHPWASPSCSARGTHSPYLTGESVKPSSRRGCVRPCPKPTHFLVAVRALPTSPTPTSHTLPAQGPPCSSSDTPGSVPLVAFAADGVFSGTLYPWFTHHLAHSSPPWLGSPSQLTYFSSSLPMVGCFVVPTHGR